MKLMSFATRGGPIEETKPQYRFRCQSVSKRKGNTYPVSALQLLADAVLEVPLLVVVVLVMSVVHLLQARGPVQCRRIAQRRYTTRTDTTRKQRKSVRTHAPGV